MKVSPIITKSTSIPQHIIKPISSCDDHLNEETKKNIPFETIHNEQNNSISKIENPIMLENELVEQGSAVVPELVSKLQSVKGVKRGVVAMTLIRIGEASVDYLRKAASDNKDFEWVAKYLISEIQGLAA